MHFLNPFVSFNGTGIFHWAGQEAETLSTLPIYHGQEFPVSLLVLSMN